MEIKNRLDILRKEMSEKGITHYLISTGDYHNSEYVGDYFKVREYYSGFTGSNGTLLVSPREALLWTDGRYFTQAEKELSGTDIWLQRMGDKGVPTIAQYLGQQGKNHKIVLGFDGNILGKAYVENIRKKCEEITFFSKEDLAGKLWKNRPDISKNPVVIHDIKFCGKSIDEKLQLLREKIEKAGADSFFTGKLDCIMWLYNLRGSDIECNPVALSYCYVTQKEACIFLQENIVDTSVEKYLANAGVEIRPYESMTAFLEEKKDWGKVLLCKEELAFNVWECFEKAGEIIVAENPIEIYKAIKNETELKQMENYYIKDSVAVCKFLYHVKTKGVKDEIEAAACMDGYRKEIEDFKEVSFPTISAYDANAAMMHYEATEKSNARIEKKGMLLVDSGGQYPGATTDVTRTIIMGPITDEEKKYFTLVAVGMLRLMNAVFLEGCTGRNLDILARLPLWEEGVDYKCGTGHGVGQFLNVHEGPHRIAWKYSEEIKETVLKEGMVVTDEPGVYFPDKFGIRTENVLYVKKKTENTDGVFLQFMPLTYAPIDRAGIEERYMEKRDVELLNNYHKAVFDNISPYLNEEEKAWLKEETKPLFFHSDRLTI